MDHYDAPWKNAIHHNLADFLAFFFPAIHASVDWAAGHCFPDHELTPEYPAGRLYPDIVATAASLAGVAVCLHIEIQACRDRNFAQRMFSYHLRLREHFSMTVTSLALLADRSPTWRPDNCRSTSAGSALSFHFSAAKLLDFHDQCDWLEAHANPFAILTLAHLAAQTTRRSTGNRYQRKRNLRRLLFAHDWSAQQRHDLFNVLDWMMPLPTDLQAEVGKYARSLQRRFDRPFENCWVTYEKKLARKSGLAEGRAKGRAEGLAAGRIAAARQLVMNLMRARFGRASHEARTRLQHASEAQLQRLGVALLKEETLQQALSAAGLAVGGPDVGSAGGGGSNSGNSSGRRLANEDTQ